MRGMTADRLAIERLLKKFQSTSPYAGDDVLINDERVIEFGISIHIPLCGG